MPDFTMAHKILIVDDKANIVVPLQFLMERNGYETVMAQSGEEALEVISKENPDLILLDIMLPGIYGFEVCEIVKLKPEWKHIKIIFLTAKRRDVDIARGMVLGADEYINKPFSNKQIVESVQKHLEEYKESKTYV